MNGVQYKIRSSLKSSNHCMTKACRIDIAYQIGCNVYHTYITLLLMTESGHARSCQVVKRKGELKQPFSSVTKMMWQLFI